jgi:hypothetical protein
MADNEKGITLLVPEVTPPNAMGEGVAVTTGANDMIFTL